MVPGEDRMFWFRWRRDVMECYGEVEIQNNNNFSSHQQHAC